MMRNLSLPMLFGLLIGSIYFLYSRAQSIPKFIDERLLRTSSEHEFGDLRFFIVGDTGTGNTAQYQVADAMEKRCQELLANGDFSLTAILLLGDNFYPDGIESTTDEKWQTHIEKPFSSPCLRQLDIYPVLGNSDYRGNTQAQVDYSRINKRWKMPHRFYRHDCGDLRRCIALESN